MLPTPDQHLFMHRQLAHVPPARLAQALEISVRFSPPGSVPPGTELEGLPWVMHMAHAWGKPWDGDSGDETPPSLHAAWSAWLPESVRTSLRPCEWPVAAVMGGESTPGQQIDVVPPALLAWAAYAGSDAFWAHMVETAGVDAVVRWGIQPLPVSRTGGSRSLIPRLLENKRYEVVRILASAGVDLNTGASKEGNSPLHASTRAEDVSLLLDLGADPLRRNAAGQTPDEYWYAASSRLTRATTVSMTGAMKAHCNHALSDSVVLFHMIGDNRSSSPWEKLRDAGWDDAVRSVPPMVFRDGSVDWSILAQVARTLDKGRIPSERRYDLLEHALHPLTPEALLTHQSLPGVPDILFAATQAVAHPFRKQTSHRLSVAQRRVYPSDREWVQAFVSSAVSWKASRARWKPEAFMSLLAPLCSSHVLAHPCPEWLGGPLVEEHASVLAPLIQEAWLTTDRRQDNRTRVLLERRWDEEETAGRTASLSVWAPALLGMVAHDEMNVGTDASLERLHRWQSAGISFSATLAIAEAILDKSGRMDRYEEDLAPLLSAIRAHESALDLSCSMPETGRSAPSRRM